MIPGSALRKLEAMTGLTASQDPVDGKYTLLLPDGQFFVSYLRDEKMACRDLREKNWKRVSNLVFESQGWVCKNCNQRRGLQCHHVRFRSRWRREDGPLDVQSNLAGLCQGCHQEEH